MGEQKSLPSISPSHRETIASLLLLSNGGTQEPGARQTQQVQQQTKTGLQATSTKSFSMLPQAVSNAASTASVSGRQNSMTIPISPAGAQAMSLMNTTSGSAAGMMSPTFNSLASLLGATSVSNTKPMLAQPSLLLGPSAPNARSSLQYYLASNGKRTSILRNTNTCSNSSDQQQQRQLLLAAAAAAATNTTAGSASSNHNSGASLLLQSLLNRST